MILPKPPKLFRTRPTDTAEAVAGTTAQNSDPVPQAWSPSEPPPVEPAVTEPTAEIPTATEPMAEATAEPIPKETAQPMTDTTPAEVEAESAGQTVTEEPETTPAEPAQSVTAAQTAQSETDFSRYARPAEPAPQISEKPEQPAEAASNEAPADVAPKAEAGSWSDSDESETSDAMIERYLGPNQKVIRVQSLNSIPFSDIWYTAEKIAYIRDTKTTCALIPFVADDLEDFYKALEQGYTGHPSFSIRFAGESYRVERIITLTGVQYNCRKMPTTVPDIFTLGLPKHIVDHLLTLSKESGLILFGGPTGMGKTTSASALMKRYLEMDGGFMYTIEDPPEMPLDGLYRAQNGGLGLCKQCPVINERWGDGIKSALRSRPRYILVGEIRTPETASQVLRAATSGHLVLSTIHASTVEDALESLIKYASGAGLTESLAADLLARGILGVVHQKLEGQEKLHPVLTSAFANPHLTGGDQMRSLIRNNTINLQTLIEAQSNRLMQGRPLFSDI